MSDDPTAPLREQTPQQIEAFLDDHLLMAMDAAYHLHPAQQDAEDHVRDRLAALSDTYINADEVHAEANRRKMDRLRRMLRAHS